MATTNVKNTAIDGPGVDALLRAMLALMVDEREARAADRPNQAKTEVLLADAGLGTADIAALLSKQPDAVRMTLSRARRKQNGKAGGDSDG
jgi:DNA-directed RNA polymerase specialized sigma24 family protein